MSLSIIIPCKNEEKSIETTLIKIRKKIFNKIKDVEYILVNDFSSDSTLKICRKLSKKYKNIIIKDNKTQGLGSAINLGVNVSKKKYVAIMMADLSDDPIDLVKYYREITKNKFDAVFGSRFKKILS